ncbi:uncharacterized protein LOC109204962 [Oreochromis niloticus]|uniref:uncharacterized protein LOC109204962 n=1 Tax=Oreochromis niloticus TaxID=8128 RepID=UPI000DF29B40|nr:uncharacterized protein LOC109204962 [Oreochromis niloticus]
MSKRPKLSGAQGRKKRKEEEEKREKDRDALLKFLNPTPGPSTTSTAAASTSAAQPTSDAASAAQPSHDAAASSGLPVASTSAAQPTSFAAASSGVPVASTSAAQPSSDAAASSGPPAAPIYAVQCSNLSHEGAEHGSCGLNVLRLPQDVVEALPGWELKILQTGPFPGVPSAPSLVWQDVERKSESGSITCLRATGADQCAGLGSMVKEGFNL